MVYKKYSLFMKQNLSHFLTKLLQKNTHTKTKFLIHWNTATYTDLLMVFLGPLECVRACFLSSILMLCSDSESPDTSLLQQNNSVQNHIMLEWTSTIQLPYLLLLFSIFPADFVMKNIIGIEVSTEPCDRVASESTRFILDKWRCILPDH